MLDTFQEKVIQIKENLNDCNQTFDVKYLGDGSYRIVNHKSQKSLDCQDESMNEGANVQQYQSWDTDSQKWIIQQSLDGRSYQIISKLNGLYMDIYGGNIANGSNIHLWSDNGQYNQRWYFFPCGKDVGQTIEDGEYHIVTALDETKGLHVKDASMADEANICINSNLNDRKQTFDVTYIGDGYYTIVNTNSGKSLHPNGGSTYFNTSLHQSELLDKRRHKWIIKDAGNGFFNIICGNSGLYVDVKDHNSADMTNVLLYVGHGGKNQRWKFVKAEVPIEKVSLNKTSLSLKKGASDSLTATISPDDTTDEKTLQWTSSNESIATVDANGKVKAVGVGSATITVTTTNGKIATCKVDVDNVIARIEGYSLSLSGDIGVNFYMTLDKTVAGDSTSKMTFNLPNGNTEEVSVVNASRKGDYYIFPCHVSAKDMTGTIVAKLMQGSKLVAQYTYTVEQYANYIFNHYDQTSSEYKITKDLMTYGYATQMYFGYQTEKLPSNINSFNTWDFSSYGYTSTSGSFIGARLVLKTTPSLKLYFSKNGNYKVDGNVVNAYKEGEYYVVEIKDTLNFFQYHTITNEDMVLKYSIASYANSVKNNTTLQDLMNAMASYYNNFYPNKPMNIIVNQGLVKMNKKNQKYQIKVELPNGKIPEVTYTSENPKVATVDANGVVTSCHPGGTDIIIESKMYGKTKCHISCDYPIEGTNYQLGDVNMDGGIDIIDTGRILDIFKFDDCTELERELADVNLDGAINALDSALVMDYIKLGYW